MTTTASTGLETVDKLTVHIVVDNNIEWFTRLPPGFTHEMVLHLERHPNVDEETGVPILELDNACCGAHGLSLLITTEHKGVSRSLLFDTGPDGRAFERNYASLDVGGLGTIERVVLSHWHRDHSGGMLTLLRLLRESGRAVTVDVHPDRPAARGMGTPGATRPKARLPPDPTLEELAAGGAVVETHTEGHAVCAGTAWVSGEIPRVTGFEEGLPGQMRWVDGAWVPEPDVMEERYVAVDVVDKGLVVFSACSHAGIVNVVRDAAATLGRPVYMIVGGLHLAGAEMEGRIRPTVEYLTEQLSPRPAYVVPLHCTGFVARVALAEALGDGCVPGGVGMRIEE